jgi:hypothetical protein
MCPKDCTHSKKPKTPTYNETVTSLEQQDHYAILGLKPGATATEIKHAYRAAAKKAHPDAGGSTEVMEAVNEAYKILSDPLARRSYDYLRTNPAPEPAAAHSSAGDAPYHPPHESAYTESRAEASSAKRHAVRRHKAPMPRANPADVRRYVWQHLEEFGWLAVVAGVALNWSSLIIADPATRIGVGMLGFLPLYWLVLQLVYLSAPDFKFRNYFTFRHPWRADSPSRRLLLVTGLLWLPLGCVWSAGLFLLV